MEATANSEGEGESEGESKPALEPLTLDGAKEFVPAGVEIDDERFTAFIDAFNGAETRADLMKVVMDQVETTIALGQERIVNDWNTLQNEWQAEVKADPELGGANLDRSLANAKDLIHTHAADPKAIEELMSLTGIGNNVHFVRLMNKLHAAIPGEAKPVTGANRPQQASRADRLFG